MKKNISILLSLLISYSVTNAQLTSDNMSYQQTSLNSIKSYQSGSVVKTNYLQINKAVPEIEKKDYLTKSRNQKTVGWCFLGAGAVGMAIGLASFPKNGDLIFGSEEDNAKANTAATITVVGSALMLGSIPFFILSKVNKRKAMAVVNNQKTGFGVPSNVSKNITGVTLTIPIGK